MKKSPAEKLDTAPLLVTLFLIFTTIALSATAERVTYTIVEENIADTMFSTKIDQHIVVTGIPSKAELETALQEFYNTAMARRFHEREQATHVWIYIYGTQQQAKAGQGLWIGMLEMTPFKEHKPEITVNERRITALAQVPEERMGISERTRKQVYLDLGDAELKAIRIAMARFPDPPQYKKQLEHERQLRDQFTVEILKKYGLPSEQHDEIMIEGFEKGWVLHFDN